MGKIIKGLYREDSISYNPDFTKIPLKADSVSKVERYIRQKVKAARAEEKRTRTRTAGGGEITEAFTHPKGTMAEDARQKMIQKHDAIGRNSEHASQLRISRSDGTGDRSLFANDQYGDTILPMEPQPQKARNVLDLIDRFVCEHLQNDFPFIEDLDSTFVFPLEAELAAGCDAQCQIKPDSIKIGMSESILNQKKINIEYALMVFIHELAHIPFLEEEAGGDHNPEYWELFDRMIDTFNSKVPDIKLEKEHF